MHMHIDATGRLPDPRRPDPPPDRRGPARRRAAGERPGRRPRHPPVGRLAPPAHLARGRLRPRAPGRPAPALLAAPRAVPRDRHLAGRLPRAVGVAPRSLRRGARAQAPGARRRARHARAGERRGHGATRTQAQGEEEMTQSTAPAARPPVVMERTYEAPVEDLWELWTTREGFESWWGPEGFRVEVHELDLRVGGALAYDM